MTEQFWVPLADEPVGELVARIESEDPEVATLVGSPRARLAFRTFSYLRVGLLLGEMLVETDVAPEGSRTWVEELVADPARYAAVVDEVRAVAREVAADPKLAGGDPVPSNAARGRLRAFARDSLADEAG